MKKEQNLATAVIAGLAVVGSDVQVGMQDVADVFLSRYETSLEAERKALQAKLIAASNQIKAATELAQSQAITTVQAAGLTRTFDTGLMLLTVTAGDKPAVDWDKGSVGVTITTRVESKTRQTGYSRTTEGSVLVDVNVSPQIMADYKEQMATKATITERLNEVQSMLRNMSSKERQIRGKIAELKLQSLGATELLENPQLLGLVDLSDIVG